MALASGKKAPAFKAETQGGEVLALADLKGAWVVLYFYPKNDTTTCTEQACEFRDSMKAIAKHGVRVIGVSPDTVKSHIKFTEKYKLNFTLLSDPEQIMCNKYDVWKEKSMYGRKYMGVIRTTYIINPTGEIVATFEAVKVKNHIEEVMATLKQLGAST